MSYTGTPAEIAIKKKIEEIDSRNEISGHSTPYFLALAPGNKSGYSFGYAQFDLKSGDSIPFSTDPGLEDYDDLYADILLSATSGGKYIFDPKADKRGALKTRTAALTAYDGTVGTRNAISAQLKTDITAALNSEEGKALLDKYTDTYFGDLMKRFATKVATSRSDFAKSTLFELFSIDTMNWFGSNTDFIQSALKDGTALSFGSALLHYIRYPKPMNKGSFSGAAAAMKRISNVVEVAGGYTPANLIDALDSLGAYSSLYLGDFNTFNAGVNVQSKRQILKQFETDVVAPAEVAVKAWLSNTYGLSTAVSLGNIYVGLDSVGNQVASLNASLVNGNSILIGGLGNSKISAGSGSDILIARDGNDLLIAGAGADTLIGAAGNDTMQGSSRGIDKFVYSGTATSASGSEVDYIYSNGNGNGTVYVGNVQLKSQNPNGISASKTKDYTWSENGITYVFTATNGNDIGILKITGDALGAGEIDVKDFNIYKAQTSAGYLGIHLESVAEIFHIFEIPVDPLPTDKLLPVTNDAANANVAAHAVAIGDGDRAKDITAVGQGSAVGFTVLSSIISDEEQTVTITASGNLEDLWINTGANMIDLSGGTATITIAAGQQSVTVGLVYAGKSEDTKSVSLTTTVGSAADGDLSGTSNSFTVNYAASTPDVVADVAIKGQSTIRLIHGVEVPIEEYVGDGANDVVIAAADRNDISGLTGNDSVVGGAGSDTIHAASGNNTISGGGGSDIITSFYGGNNEIYAGKQVDFATALTQAKDTPATSVRGSFIGVGDGNNTIVGSAGDDVVIVGTGSNTIVFGAGHNNFWGGVIAGVPDGDWSVQPGVGGVITGITAGFEPFVAPEGYEGSSLVIKGISGNAGMGSDTIFGGVGDSVYYLANGNNYLDAGGGNDYIQAGIGNNTIYGSSGNDTIFGGGGNTYINAESGNDTIIGQGGNLTVFGGTGNTIIHAGDVDADGGNWAGTRPETQSYIVAGSGTTELYGSAGHDTLIGGSGNDTISGGDGTEYIEAGSGDTSINGGGGDDTIIGGSGSDTIFGGKGATVISAGDGGTADHFTEIHAGSGDTTIIGGTGFDVILGGSGNNLIYAGDGGDETFAAEVLGGSGATTIYGGSGIDFIKGGSGTTVIYSGDGGTSDNATSLFGGSGDATIYGGSGVDDITAGGGSNQLVAGSGTTEFFGGSGAATYVINSGSGATTINNSSFADTLKFGDGIAVQDISISEATYLNGTVYTLSLSDGGSVTVNPGGLSGVTLADGSTITFDQLLSPSFSSGDDTYSDRSTTVHADGASSTPTLTFLGNADLVGRGTSVSAIITANSGNDTLIAGTASDTLVGGGGETDGVETYVVTAGAGTVTTINKSGSADTLIFGAGITMADLSIAMAPAADGSSILTLHTSTGGAIVINGGAGSPYGTVDQLAFADGSTGTIEQLLARLSDGATAGTSSVDVVLGDGIQHMTLTGSGNLTVTGNDLEDLIVANTGNDTLIAGGGDDTLVGGGGVATYVVNQTSNVVIRNSGNADTLSFGAGIGRAGLTASSTVVDNMAVVTISDTDSEGYNGEVVIQGGGLQRVSFADGSTVTLADLLAPSSIEGTAMFSSVSATAGAGVTTLNMTGSADVVATANGLNDVIQSNGGADTLVAGGGNDTLIGGGTHDTYVVAAGTQVTTVERSGMDDTLSFGAGVGTANLSASAAIAADGSRVVTISNSLGGSVVVDGSGNGMLDMIAFADGSSTSLSELLAQATGGASAASSAVSVTLADGVQHMTLTGSADVSATGNALDNVIVANRGNDTLIAGTGGNDTLSGGGGLATYAINQGGGKVLITNSGQDDALLFGAGISQGSLTATTTTVDGVKTVAIGYVDAAGASGSVVVQGGALTQVLFADGSFATLDQLLAPSYVVGATLSAYSSVSITAPSGVVYLTMTGDSDVVATGNTQDNVIRANSGDDTLIAGSGNATLVGGGLSDTYVAQGARAVDIKNSGAGDTLELGAASANGASGYQAHVQTAADGSTSVVLYNSAHGTVTIDAGVDGMLDQVVFSDGSSASLSALVAQTGYGSAAATSSVSGALDDGIQNMQLQGSANLVVTGNNLDDYIVANSGNDTLIAGTGGNDTLVGGSGHNTYVINDLGTEIVVANSGSGDVLAFGADISQGSLKASSTVVNGVTVVTLTYADGDGDTGQVVLQGGALNNVVFAGGGTATLSDLLGLSYTQGATTYSQVSTTAGASIPNLDMTGSADVVATANALDDVIRANLGHDTLVAGGGDDTLIGGGLSDTYVIANGSQTTTIEKSGTADTLRFGAGVTLADLSVVASIADDGTQVLTLHNSLGGTVVIATGGASPLDQIVFADGSGASLGQMVARLDSGPTAAISAVNVTLGDGIQNLTVTGTADTVVIGNDLDNFITANSGHDTLLAGTGSDDTLRGGGGVATYLFEEGNGNVLITNSAGADTLAFGAGIGQNNLTTSSAVVDGVTVVTILDSAGGKVVVEGGGLSQVSFADGSTATLSQLLAPSYTQGTTTFAQVSSTAGAGVTTLVMTGSADVAATGNALDDVIWANASGHDTLVAGGGDDTLVGGGITDTFVASIGGKTTVAQSRAVDTLGFGAGVTLADLSATETRAADGSTLITIKNALGGSVVIEDNYYSPMDRIVFADGGTASISQLLAQATSGITAAVSDIDVQLGAGIQNMTLTGTANLSATGNAVDDVITANGGNDLLTAGSGHDTLVAGAGNDTLVGAGGHAVMVVGSGRDTLIAGAGGAVFDGGSHGGRATYQVQNDSGLVDIIDSGANDTLQFGADVTPRFISAVAGVGADGVTPLLTITADKATVLVHGSGDLNFALADGTQLTRQQLLTQTFIDGATQYSSASTTLDAALSNLVLTGSADLVGTVGDRDGLLVGNAGNDTLIAGDGADTLVAASGNTTFYINNTNDLILGASDGGHNSVMSTVTYVLPHNVNNLTLTGDANLLGMGGDAAGVVRANSGNDTLIGGTGGDTLVAGGGADLLVGSSAATTYQFNLGTGADTIIAGASGGDTISFGAGITLANMQLIYTVGAPTAVLKIDGGGDQITLASDIAGTVANFKFADGSSLTSAQLLNQIATNALNQVGGGGSGVLSGASGNDTLNGGAGNTTLIGGAGKDTYVFGRQSGYDTVVEQAGQTSVMALAVGVAWSDLQMQRAGNDLRVVIAGTQATMVLSNYFSKPQSWSVQTADGQAAALDGLYQAAATQQAGLSDAAKVASYETGFESAMRANIAALYGASGGADGDYTLAPSLQPNRSVETVYATLAIQSLVTTGDADELDSQISNPVTFDSTEVTADHTVTSVQATAITPDPVSVTVIKGTQSIVNANPGVTSLDSDPNYIAQQQGTSYTYTQNFPTYYTYQTVSYTYTDVLQVNDQAGLTYQIETINGGAGNSLILYNDTAAPSAGTVGVSSANATTPYFSTAALSVAGDKIIHAGAGDVWVSSFETDDAFAGQYESSHLASGGLDETGVHSIGSATQFDFSGAMLNSIQFLTPTAGSGNFIQGGTGNDTLVGSANGDMLIAGAGDNLLNGGGGADTYVALPDTKGWSVIYDSGQEMTLAQQASAKTYQAEAATLTYQSGLYGLFGTSGSTTYTTGAETYVVWGQTDYNNNQYGPTPNGFTEYDGQWFDYGGTWDGYEADKVPVDTVVFAAGIKLSQLSFSWGVVQGDSLHQTLNISWADETGYRIAMANDQDTTDFGVELFQFADGTVMTMAQMLAYAPPRPANYDASPTLAAPLAAQSFNAKESYRYVIPEHTFLDQNVVDAVQYSVAMADGGALPSWLSFDAASRTLLSVGAPPANGAFDLRVTATDPAGLSSSTTFALTVGNAGIAAGGFNFHTGMGQQTLASTENLVRFAAGIAPANLKVTRDGLDLLVADGADVLRIAGWYANPPRAVSVSGAFSDGGSWDTAAATQQGLTLVDTHGNATLRGLDNYANVLVGGANDTLLGGAAGNTFVVAAGDGVVHVTASGSGNTLRFGSGINAADVTLVSGSVLTLQLDGAGDQVQIAGFDPANPQTSGTVQNFAFADGTVLTYAQLLARGFDIHAGAGNVSVAGGALNERIYAGSGNDTLNAGAGNDTLIAGAGVDSLLGGAGDDTYVINSASDVVVEGAGQGTDTVQVSFNYVLPSGVENLVLGGGADLVGTGNALNNSLTGNAGNDTLSGGSGADTLIAGGGLATMQGGVGDDLYVVNNVNDVVSENAGEGADVVQSSVSYVIPANVESLILTGGADLTGTGGAGNDVLTGNAGRDTLIGGAGNDKLIAGSGVATLVGGLGNDIYVVNNSADVITEQAGEGNDSVSSSVNFVLPENVELLTLSGSADLTASGNDMAGAIVGNAGNDTLQAGSGKTTLSAGTGLATLIGGVGDNTFTINNVNDVIIEQANAGTDTLNSSVSYVLPANVENLMLTGSANLMGTGNDGKSALFANAGNDTLRAGAGDTWFYAGSGVATMIGGLGNNNFNVNNAADVVVAQAGAVLNTVTSTISYVMGDNVRVLNLKGGTGLTATGNALNDTITASTGNDTLYAGSGNATLTGGIGVDALVGGGGNDLLADLVGKGGLWGGAGNDKLSVAGANSFIAGGVGDDTVSLGATASVVAFNAGDGADTVTGAAGAAATLSLGGGIDYSSLSFAKSGNDLVLKTGGSESVTLQGWYAATAVHDINTLQVAEVSNASYDAASSNALYNSKIEEFNFSQLVAQFDQARTANPALSSWNLMDGLLSAHLSGSDTAAIGGDMAYAAATQGTGTALNLGTMVATLQDPQYGKAGQALHA